MLKRKLKVCWLLPSLFIVLLSHDLIQAQSLRLDISLSDTTYYVSQSIWLDATLTDTSEDTVRIFGFEFPGGNRLNVVLTNETGDTLRPVLRFEFLDWSGFLLNPGETYYETFDLADIFHMELGKYEVSAEYYRTSTPKISLEVTEPTGAERQAFELYTEAFKNQNRTDYFPSKQLLSKLITSYPKSVYAEKAYWRVHGDEELLEKCPDSGYHQGHLRTAIDKMSNEEKQRFLQKVIKEHPGTRSARFAEQMLRLRR
ncbi:MAG: hypothetical protein WBC42_13660 [Candidatus Zixiibacteriota bacterium]